MKLGIDFSDSLRFDFPKQAEAALRSSQQMLRLVMDNIPQAIFWKDRNSVYLGCNRSGAMDAGLASPKQIVGLTDYDLPWTREQAEFFRECDARVMTTGIPEYHIIAPQRQADGKHAWLDTNQIPLHNMAGDVVGVLVTYEDITERKNTEESLLRISKAIESSSDAIGMSDASGIHIYQNRAFSQLFEYETVEELNAFGGPNVTYVDPTISQDILTTLSQGRSWRGEVTKRAKSGHLVQVLLRADAIKDSSGKIVGLICINTDITERKRSEAKILESAQRLAAVIETVGEGITLSDVDGSFAIFNSRMQEITGYTCEEAKNINHFLRLLSPDEQAYLTAVAELQDILENKGVRDVETMIKTKYGTYRTLLISTSILHYQNRNWCLSAYRDITDRKQAQEALKRAEQKYRSVFENAIEGIFQTTIDGHYISVNPALVRMYGYSTPDELITKLTNIERQLYIDPRRRTEFVSLLQEHDFVSGFESQIYRSDGSIIWISENARAVRDAQGKLLYYEGTVEEITHRKQAEEIQRQQAERERLMGLITQRIRQSLKLEVILSTTVAEVRQFLQTDRVVIYRFQSDGSGMVAVESVAPEWISIEGKTIADTCLSELYLQSSSQAMVCANEDIGNANLSACHIELLTQFQVQANLVVPIVQGETLWGLLAAHQCSNKRQWQQLEINLLKQLATQLAIAIQQAELYQQLEEVNQELERLACLDGLTLIANRWRFDQYLDVEWRRASREQIPISLILCDVDFFKRYNDTYGHQAGDACLKQVAAMLNRAVKRPTDLVARYGGEEFAIILPKTDTEGALHVAERVRYAMATLRRPHAKSDVSEYVTISMGVASMLPDANTPPVELIATADKALYRAKEMGRDQIILGS